MKKSIYLISVGILLLGCAHFSYGQKVVTASQVNGTWRDVTSKPAGVTTEFRIWALGGGKLHVQFFGNNAAKKFANDVMGDADIDGITAVFKPEEAQTDAAKPCVMTLKFSAAKLTVAEDGECGWGAGIGSAGTYKKVSTKKPAF